jgi:hypothetical protein
MQTLKEFLTNGPTTQTPVNEAFTKQHYIAIAKVIAGQRNVRGHESEDVNDALDAVAIELAAMFAADNSAFDKGRFLSACGV